MGRKRLHEAAIDVALDAVADEMRRLPAEFDQIGPVGAGWNGGDRVDARPLRD